MIVEALEGKCFLIAFPQKKKKKKPFCSLWNLLEFVECIIPE